MVQFPSMSNDPTPPARLRYADFICALELAASISAEDLNTLRAKISALDDPAGYQRQRRLAQRMGLSYAPRGSDRIELERAAKANTQLLNQVQALEASLNLEVVRTAANRDISRANLFGSARAWLLAHMCHPCIRVISANLQKKDSWAQDLCPGCRRHLVTLFDVLARGLPNKKRKRNG
jgi:hypothetical protein